MTGKLASRCVSITTTIAAALLIALSAAAPAALAGELKVMSTVALNAPLEELKTKFERKRHGPQADDRLQRRGGSQEADSGR